MYQEFLLKTAYILKSSVIRTYYFTLMSSQRFTARLRP
jgi:hypothetical protein